MHFILAQKNSIVNQNSQKICQVYKKNVSLYNKEENPL